MVLDVGDDFDLALLEKKNLFEAGVSVCCLLGFSDSSLFSAAHRTFENAPA